MCCCLTHRAFLEGLNAEKSLVETLLEGSADINGATSGMEWRTWRSLKCWWGAQVQGWKALIIGLILHATLVRFSSI